MTAAGCTFKTVDASTGGRADARHELADEDQVEHVPALDGQHYQPGRSGASTPRRSTRGRPSTTRSTAGSSSGGARSLRLEGEPVPRLLQRVPDGVLITPFAGFGNQVALSAWVGDPSRYYKDGYYGIGKLSVCPTFSEKAFATFRDTYRGHGPEGIPLSADQQGTGPGA